MKRRLSVREKARRRDGVSPVTHPQPGRYWHGLVLTNGLELWYVRVVPDSSR